MISTGNRSKMRFLKVYLTIILWLHIE